MKTLLAMGVSKGFLNSFSCFSELLEKSTTLDDNGDNLLYIRKVILVIQT